MVGRASTYDIFACFLLSSFFPRNQVSFHKICQRLVEQIHLEFHSPLTCQAQNTVNMHAITLEIFTQLHTTWSKQLPFDETFYKLFWKKNKLKHPALNTPVWNDDFTFWMPSTLPVHACGLVWNQFRFLRLLELDGCLTFRWNERETALRPRKPLVEDLFRFKHELFLFNDPPGNPSIATSQTSRGSAW
jgi:hypothetical protein